MRKIHQSRVRRHALLLAVSTALSLTLASLAQAGDAGFSISVDGERVAGDAAQDGRSPSGDADIQVKFDGLDVRPILNVSTTDLRRSYRAGEPVAFLATSNYPAFIAKGEVLVFDRDSSRVAARLPVDAAGQASWTMPGDGPADFDYVLRVYDAQGRYDETAPLSLARTAGRFAAAGGEGGLAADGGLAAVSPGNGEDRTAVRNIPVHGGAVTVYGKHVPDGAGVTALGEKVPVDREGKFVVQRILPPGDHAVAVAVTGEGAGGLDFKREINIPDNEWFYVAVGDLTVGRRFGDKVEAAGSGYDRTFTSGRMAFYLKGKIKGKYLLTASADTDGDSIGDMLKGIDGKDPRQLLKRVDPDDYYPVYGDDSTAIDDAPTDGKLYVRLERGDSHVMWGKFKTDIHGPGLIHNERQLQGAEAVYKSESATKSGERRVEVKAYAAQPGTLPQRDILRGTGGSAYFLKRQDISTGSETLTVIVRDRVSGRELSRRSLIAGRDYDINYVQGVVILKQPLQSAGGDGDVVKDEPLGGDEVSLVAQYEYTPPSGDVDGYSTGGRAQAWIGDHVRVGVTGMDEQTGAADQQMAGADVRIEKSERTFIEGEVAGTRGPGFSRSFSTDGGLTILDDSGADLGNGKAWSLRGQVDVADLGLKGVDGTLGAYAERKDAGFSTLDSDILVDNRSWGVHGDVKATDRTKLRLAVDDYRDAGGKREQAANAEAEYRLTDTMSATVGVKHTDRSGVTDDADGNGERTDAGLRLSWKPDDDRRLYVFGQATAARSGGIARNDRAGVGGSRKLTDTIGAEGEASYGTSGPGVLAALTYDPTADDHYYGGYRLDPDRTLIGTTLKGTDAGGIVAGARRRYSDTLSSFAENNYDAFGKRTALTSTYGVTYTPDPLWTVTGALESGQVRDRLASDFDRNAVSASVGYKDVEGITASLKGELRFDRSDDGSRDGDSYLLSSGLGVKLDRDWRLVAKSDVVVSKSDQSSILNGNYVDVSTGFAYRPAEHDALNALFKARVLYDLPGPDQTTAEGLLLGPAQRSLVISADANYDLTRRVAIGGKYGLRLGEVSTTRAADDFMRSTAQIGIMRADLHIVDKWDGLIEGRILHANEIGTTNYGTLIGLYREVGEHMKFGGGYNFGRFSDDLTDLVQDDGGAFVNVVGSF